MWDLWRTGQTKVIQFVPTDIWVNCMRFAEKTITNKHGIAYESISELLEGVMSPKLKDFFEFMNP